VCTSFTKKALLAVLACAWISFWFWAFSFAFSSSFFTYNQHTRLPTFIAALFASCAIPASALIQWRSVVRNKRGSIAAFVRHVLCTMAALAVPFGISFVLAKAPRPWRLEADDAVGVGIDTAILLLVTAVCGVSLAAALWFRHVRASGLRRRDA
jgi:hypothetical protein